MKKYLSERELGRGQHGAGGDLPRPRPGRPGQEEEAGALRGLHRLPQPGQDSGLPGLPELPRPEALRRPGQAEEGLYQASVRDGLAATGSSGKSIFNSNSRTKFISQELGPEKAVAIKSEPGGVYSVKAEAGAAPAIGLSWPSQQFQPTFQVQVSLTAQFSYHEILRPSSQLSRYSSRFSSPSSRAASPAAGPRRSCSTPGPPR